jgi:hypothetical protein
MPTFGQAKTSFVLAHRPFGAAHVRAESRGLAKPPNDRFPPKAVNRRVSPNDRFEPKAVIRGAAPASSDVPWMVRGGRAWRGLDYVMHRLLTLNARLVPKAVIGDTRPLITLRASLSAPKRAVYG